MVQFPTLCKYYCFCTYVVPDGLTAESQPHVDLALNQLPQVEMEPAMEVAILTSSDTFILVRN